MGENSGISWTDHTFNPWMGCTKVSPACANCYAERDMDHRYGKVKWGDGGTRVKTSAANWKKPLQWNSQARLFVECVNPGCRHRWELADGMEESFCPKCGDPEAKSVRPRIFCASLADVFEAWIGPIHSGGDIICRPYLDSENTPEFWVTEAEESLAVDPQGWNPITMDDLRRELFKLIDATPHLDWLLLTKRPENISKMWPVVNKDRDQDGSEPWHRENVWIGTSVENQHYADTRIPELLKCRDLSPVLFLSCEPVVGQIEFGNVTKRSDVIQQWGRPLLSGINWVITGGESGPAARPADPKWFRSLRDQCAAVGVPFHFKQWGEYDEHQARVGKKAAGRLLDGVLHDAFPITQEQPV